ncbi:MAG: Do family serine endopeptidase [Myxococcales bacterium]
MLHFLKTSLAVVCFSILALAGAPGAARAARAPAGGLWHDQPAGTSLSPDITEHFPSLAPLVAQIKPAVVNISTTQHIRHPGFYGYGPGPFDQFFQQFFGGQVPQREIERQSLGSGFIVDEDGYVLTNNHVIEGADQIRVKLADGRELPAKVVGADSKTDVALLELEGGGKFPYLLLGDSDVVQVGDWVIAIGNPFGLELSVTHGIVSAKERTIGAGPYDQFIQSDALINPGNSGGPLFDIEGGVVGINTAITRQGQGIGFAVPINTVKQLLPQLLEGHVVRGFLGAGLQPLTPDLAQSFGVSSTKGALVANVEPGGPAARAGLRPGDVVVAFNGTPVHSVNQLVRAVAGVRPGTKVAMGIIRDGSPKGLKVKVGERPDDQGEGAGQGQGGEPGGQEAQPRQDALGLSVRGLGGQGGVQVTAVAPESPAAEAGLTPGDQILEVNQKPVHTTSEYLAALGATRKGKMVTLRVQRQNESIYFAMKMK